MNDAHENRVNLRLLLVSGSSCEFQFSPDTTAQEVADFVHGNWPAEWMEDERPPNNILRLIYQGRFLHGNITLSALNLPVGKTTVMHLVPRENLPEPNQQGQKKKVKTGSSGCCNNCCTVL